MPTTTPRFFFENFVLPNYYDSESKPQSIRHAFNAVISATHIADHYWEYYKRHDPSIVKNHENFAAFKKTINRKTGGDYNDILSLANAYKHLYERESQSAWTMSSPGVLHWMSFANIGAQVTSIGFNPDLDSKLIFTRLDGTQKDFMKTLGNVIGFWQDFL